MRAGDQVREARWSEDVVAVRTLLRNYAAHLATTPHAADGICIQGFEDELARLPDPYTSAGHGLLLAEADGAVSGCVAMHLRTVADEPVAEVKRLWTEPAARGRGLGRGLVEAAVNWAQNHGCAAVVLDTHPVAMPEAGALYLALGFRTVERFNTNPVPDIVFYRLDLHDPAPVQ